MERVKENKMKIEEPKFLDPSELTEEQLTNPDYRLEELMRSNGAHPVTCSKCHHCR